jgi:hypothetical protein
MGDAIAVLPTDKIPSTSTEKEAIILLYGDTQLHESAPEVVVPSPLRNLSPSSMKEMDCSSSPNLEYIPNIPPTSVKSNHNNPNHNPNHNQNNNSYRGEMTTIFLLVIMFAIWTLPPFSIYVQECIPIFKKLWVLYWFLQILFFGIYAFFVMNIDLVKTK